MIDYLINTIIEWLKNQEIIEGFMYFLLILRYVFIFLRLFFGRSGVGDCKFSQGDCTRDMNYCIWLVLVMKSKIALSS